MSKQGKEATIALLGPGDFLGEGCIASDQTVRMATASATSDCAVLRIQRKILRVLHQERAFSDTFVAYLLLSHFEKKDRPETVIPARGQSSTARLIQNRSSSSAIIVVREPRGPVWSVPDTSFASCCFCQSRSTLPIDYDFGARGSLLGMWPSREPIQDAMSGLLQEKSARCERYHEA